MASWVGVALVAWQVTGVAHACPNQGLARVDVPGTVCNDGAPMVAHYRPPTRGHEAEWLVVLEGGEACFNTLSCLSRASSRPDLVSGSSQPSCWPAGGTAPDGIFDSSDFGDGHVVFARYCSSDNWTGDREDSSVLMRAGFGRPFAMRGHQNLVALFNQLQDLPRLADPDATAAPEPADIVFAGVSAGAFGMAQFINQIPPIFPGATVRGISDSAVYMSASDTIQMVQAVTVLDANPLTGAPVTAADRNTAYFGCGGGPCLPAGSLPYNDLTPGTIAGRYSYWNAQHDPSCLAGEAWRRVGAREHVEACGDARVLYDYIDVPVFVFGFSDESHFMGNVETGRQLMIRNPGLAWNPVFWAPAYDSVVASFRAGTQIVQNQGDIRLLGGHAGNAAFMPRAPGHTVLLERRYFQTLVSPGGAPSSSVEQELTNWVGGQGRTLIH